MPGKIDQLFRLQSELPARPTGHRVAPHSGLKRAGCGGIIGVGGEKLRARAEQAANDRFGRWHENALQTRQAGGTCAV